MFYFGNGKSPEELTNGVAYQRGLRSERRAHLSGPFGKDAISTSNHPQKIPEPGNQIMFAGMPILRASQQGVRDTSGDKQLTFK